MANRVVLGKSTNTNLGHSTDYGFYISRSGDNIESCTKDQLVLNTDKVGNASGATDIGQFQVVPQTVSGNAVGSAQLSVNASTTAAVSFTNLTSTGHLLYAAFDGTIASESNVNKLFRTNYSGAASGNWENLGDTTITANVMVMKGFSTNALF